MEENELKYLIGINHFSKFGPKRIKMLQTYFPSLEEAFWAPAQILIKAGINEQVALEFSSSRNSIDIDQIILNLDKENIGVIALGQKNYPRLLKEIYDPPALLYYKGELSGNDEFSLAVVGTRKHTHYGQQVTEDLVRNLTKNQLTIISGLALGIDTIAHTTCLNNNGRTIAVLGTGIDKQSIYPGTNRYLVDKIVATGGLVISEFPLKTAPLRYNFPQRNRIIAGLSLGTLVVEAGEKSGALITATCALEQNREVFAVPGSIYSSVSIGPNNLLKQGAKMVTTAEEIMEALDLKEISSYIENKKIIPETPEEEIILKHLSPEPIHINDLIRLTGLETAQINSTLTIMEMKGMIRNLGSMEYIINY